MTELLDATGHIVVGADLTRSADHAVDWAAERAAARGLPLLVVMVGPDEPAGPDQRAAGRLEELAERTRAACPGLDVRTRVIEGKVSPVMAQLSLSAEMVVLGSRGEAAPWSVRLLGGTSDAVAGRARCPVAIIRADGPATFSGPVVVGIDDSPEAMAAVSFAVDEAVARGTGLVGVHVWDSTPTLVAGSGLWGGDGSQVASQLETMVDQIMEPYLAEHPDLAYRTMVLPGRAPAVLADLSDAASLVVIGSHARNPLVGLLLGSASRGVPREAGCPVILVHP